jgi:hypothetical protein
LIAPDIVSKNYISILRISVEEFYLQIKQEITYYPVAPEKAGLLIIFPASMRLPCMDWDLGEFIISCDHSAHLCLVREQFSTKS